MLGWNVTLPMMLAMAVTYSNVRVWARIYKVLCYVAIIASGLSLIFLSIGWAFYCNHGGTGSRTACNDYRWCGVYFASAGGHCTNGVGFLGLTSGHLERNQQMTEHWIYCFVFLTFAYLHTLMYSELRGYGILK